MLPESGKEQHFVTGGSGGDGIYNIRHIVLLNGTARDGRECSADAGKQQAQIIIDLGHGANRGTWGSGDHLLFDRNSGTQAFNIVDIRFVHPRHELTCVFTKTFGIAALSFSEQGIDSQGGFARTRDSGNYDQFIAGNADVDILEVVDPGSFNNDRVSRTG